MPVSLQEPQAIANPNAIPATDFINPQLNLSASVAQPANPSESNATYPRVMQLRLATDPHIQREVATSKAPESTEPIESSVGNQQFTSEMPVSSEQPQAIASPNARQEEVFTKAESDLTSPVSQPTLPSESQTTGSSVVQPRLATEHQIQREIATPQAPEAAEPIDSSVENQQPSSEMGVSSEQQASASADAMPGVDFINPKPNLASPVSQSALASESETTDSSVVQPRLATEHQIQREIATPQIPEATESIESSTGNLQPPSEMGVSSEQPQAIANTNTRQGEGFINPQSNPSTPVPQPALASESETTSSSVVQSRLATEHHIQREVATPQATEAAESIESSVENQQSASEIPVSSEQPQAIANTNTRQEEVFTKAEPGLTSPVPQPALASESETTDSSVVQPRLATEHHIQREIATPQAPEAAEPIESSVENQQSASEIPVSSEQPQAIANTNTRQEEVFTKAEPDLTSPVPQPALASESETTSSSVVQSRLATEHHIQREVATPQATEAAESIESSVENQQSASEIPVSSKEPQAIASPNAIPAADFINPQLNLSASVSQPGLPSESDVTTPSVVQPRLATEHHIQRETTPVTQDNSLPYSKQQSVEVAKPDAIPDEIHVAPKLEVALPVADPQQAIAEVSPPKAEVPDTENSVNIPEPAIEQRTSEPDRVSQVAENESLIQEKATEQAIAQPDNSLVSPRLELGKESATQELSTATPEVAPEGQTPTELAVVQPLLGTEASDLNSQVLPRVSESPQLPESFPSGEAIVQSKAVPEIAAPDISSMPPLSESSGLPRVSEQLQPPESSVRVEATEQTAHDNTKVDAIANSNSVTPVAQGESIVQSKQLPETTAQAPFNAPLLSETEPLQLAANS
jgi:hypothetical protein